MTKITIFLPENLNDKPGSDSIKKSCGQAAVTGNSIDQESLKDLSVDALKSLIVCNIEKANRSDDCLGYAEVSDRKKELVSIIQPARAAVLVLLKVLEDKEAHFFDFKNFCAFYDRYYADNPAYAGGEQVGQKEKFKRTLYFEDLLALNEEGKNAILEKVGYEKALGFTQEINSSRHHSAYLEKSVKRSGSNKKAVDNAFCAYGGLFKHHKALAQKTANTLGKKSGSSEALKYLAPQLVDHLDFHGDYARLYLCAVHLLLENVKQELGQDLGNGSTSSASISLLTPKQFQ